MGTTKDDDRLLRSLTAFGAALRRWRNKRRLSQESLASRLGTLPHVISDYERAKRTPSFVTLARLAMALDCQPHHLLQPARQNKSDK